MSERSQTPRRRNSKHDTTGRFALSEGDLLDLLVSQQTEVVDELTFQFCDRFVRRAEDTFDRMIITARSATQTVVEANAAAPRSKSKGLRLSRFARNTLADLVDEYEGIVQSREHPLWRRDSLEARYVRRVFESEPARYETWRRLVESRSDADVANIVICVINETGTLLDQRITRLARAIEREHALSRP